MGFCPVLSGMDGDPEGNGEGHDRLHLSLNEGEQPLEFLFRGLKDQFVMDLHDHLGGKAGFFDPVLDWIMATLMISAAVP